MTNLPTVLEAAGLIDHAILKPELDRKFVDSELAMAAKYQLFSVCVRPSDISYVTEQLSDSTVKTSTVIGFPHGTTSTAAKQAELVQALSDGADEFDLVINIGWLKSGLYQQVETDLAKTIAEANGKITKVILETSYLSPEEIQTASKLAEQAGTDFVKTATGFASRGASVEDLKLMRSAVSDKIQLKASGGVRSLATFLEYLNLGVTRFGTSSSPAILDELAAKLSGTEYNRSDETGGY